MVPPGSKTKPRKMVSVEVEVEVVDGGDGGGKKQCTLVPPGSKTKTESSPRLKDPSGCLTATTLFTICRCSPANKGEGGGGAPAQRREQRFGGGRMAFGGGGDTVLTTVSADDGMVVAKATESGGGSRGRENASVTSVPSSSSSLSPSLTGGTSIGSGERINSSM